MCHVQCAMYKAMYNVPGLWNAADLMYPVVAEDLETSSNEAEYRSLTPCDSDIVYCAATF